MTAGYEPRVVINMLNVELASRRCEFAVWQPSHGRIFEAFAYDTETTEIVDARPDIIPQVVLATAYDGHRGVIIHRENLLSFFQAHAGVPFIGHNVAYDLAVSQQLFAGCYDIYAAVEAQQVWCTMVLHRLLSLATTGESARDECSLRHCVEQHLGITLEKDVRDAQGRQVRVNFARYLGAPLASIPPEYLRYAAGDTMATWALFQVLKEKVRDVLCNSNQVYGYVNDEWLHNVVGRFGPLTHHLQLRVSIVLDAINRQGLCVDHQRQQQKLAAVTAEMETIAECLQSAGFVVHGPGSNSDLQRKLDDFHQQHPAVSLKTTESGKWSTAAEDLASLGAFDNRFQDLSALRVVEKLKSTYLDKMDQPVVFPKYRFLASTAAPLVVVASICKHCRVKTSRWTAHRRYVAALSPGLTIYSSILTIRRSSSWCWAMFGNRKWGLGIRCLNLINSQPRFAPGHCCSGIEQARTTNHQS